MIPGYDLLRKVEKVGVGIQTECLEAKNEQGETSDFYCSSRANEIHFALEVRRGCHTIDKKSRLAYY
jgi:hypothetical protein